MSNKTTSERRRRRRWPWVVLGAVLLVSVLSIHFSLRRFTDPERLRSLAESYLRQFSPGAASVASARFSWFDGIRLFNVSLHEASIEDHSDRMLDPSITPTPQFSANEIRLTPNLLSAVFGKLTIDSVLVTAPICNIVRDAATGRINLADVLRRAGLLERASLSRAAPAIELRKARIRVFDRDAGSDHLVEDLTLTIRGGVSQRGSRFYDLVWQSGGPLPEDGHAQIDLTTGRMENIRGGLPWMSIEAVMIAVNARYDAAGTWSDLLGLDGRVRATDFKLGGRRNEDPRSATVELRDARLSIPIDEAERPPAGGARYLQFDHVNGTVQLTDDDVHADFDGFFHDSPCQVVASLRTVVQDPATLDDVDFDVRLTVKNLPLPDATSHAPPEQSRFVERWPRLARFFRDYHPCGRVDVALEAGKEAGRDSPITVRRITLQAVEADASWRFFPYRVTGLSGTVEITPQRITISNLEGVHHSGRITVNGNSEQPQRGWPGTIIVTGRRIPIDDALQAALPARFQAIRPLLNPEGGIDVDLTMTRPMSEGSDRAPWDVETSIRFDGLTARYVGFPYPLRELAGTVAIHENRLELIDVAARAGDAPVAIKGHAVIATNRPADLDFELTATGVAIDETLFKSLPGTVRERVALLAPAGRFDVTTLLTRESTTETLHHSSTIRFDDASFQHEVFPGRVEQVNGTLTVDPVSIDITDLSGNLAGGSVAIRGSLDHSTPQHQVDLQVECRGPGMAPSLLSLLLAKQGGLLTDVTVNGPAGATVYFRRTGVAAMAVSGNARLEGVSVQHPRLPVPLESVTAGVSFDAAGVRATEVDAVYAGAQLRFEVETREGAFGAQGQFKGEAGGLLLDEALRAILSEAQRRIWDHLGPAGKADLRIDRLAFQTTEPDGTREWSVEGQLLLQDVALSGLHALKRANGTVSGTGWWVDRLGGITMDGTLVLDRLECAGHPLEDLRGSWSFARREDGVGIMTVDVVGGQLYEGMLTGQLKVALERDGASYDSSLNLKGINITSGLAKGPATSGPMAVQGLLDLHLYLAGRYGDPLSQRGGGRIEITNGPMHRLPIMKAILEVIGLTVPDDYTFHDTTADFFVVGNRIELHDIILRGDLLMLVGSGTMTWPDQGLDLDLVHVSPYRWARLPVLADLVEGTTRTFVELHVTGPLSQPTVTARPLPSVSDEIRKLFQKKPPKKPIAQNAADGG